MCDLELRIFTGHVTGSCGLGVVHSFAKDTPGSAWYQPVNVAVNYAGGTGFFVAAFVNTKICKEVFDKLTKDYKVVMQSPARRNHNSGRNFFFLILDRKKGDKRLGYTPVEAKWPWKRTTVPE